MTKRPAMPKGDSRTAALFGTLLPADSRIVVRPMFGQAAAFVNGHMFAGTFGTRIFVRLDDQNRAELLAAGGARVFEPMKGRPMREYVELPESMAADRSRAWVSRAFESISRLPAKVKSGRIARAPAAGGRPRSRARTRR
ncbi:MAG TPA: TfoX/Sxy family protein [Vicinamibacterales bacterium]|nr:TfoX/Sxy family protein [Vicinamibacterales bacterium]